MSEYIYLRWHRSYKKCIKLGKCICPIERDNTYKTGELKRGHYIMIWKIKNKDSYECEKLLQYLLKDYHKYYDGGTEFYDIKIYYLIENLFKENNIEFEEVDLSEIKKKIRLKTELDKYRRNIIYNKYKKKIENKRNEIKLREYQNNENIINWFDHNDKGILNWCCGLGKTITSLNISKKYVKKYLLIGLNNISLFEQLKKEIKKFYNLPIIEIRGNMANNKIKNFLSKNGMGIIITTYRSSHKLKRFDLVYDFAIFDEVHHLCNVKHYSDDKSDDPDGCLDNVNNKKFHRNIDILDLNITRQLGLTATMKELTTDKKKIDNTDKNIFGEIIDEKSISWAINSSYICDYKLSIPMINLQELEEMIESNHSNGVLQDDYYLYLSAYMALISILEHKRKKILIFTNKIDDIIKIEGYIKCLLRSEEFFSLNYLFDNIYPVHEKSKNNFIKDFNEVDKGIMINVYKIGEGVDIPTLDSVLFADNMNSSIRIIQSALRPCRKDENNPGKIAHIIIPMIYEKDDDMNFNSNDDEFKIKTFALLKQIIEEISISDDNVMQKIKVCNIAKSENKEPSRKKESYGIPELEHKIKLRLIDRNSLGRKQFPAIKRIIQKIGGRKDINNTLFGDYEKTKQGKEGLPTLDWMKKYLEVNNKTWLDLYEIDTTNWIKWDEFESRFKNKITREDYIKKSLNDITLPNNSDLDDYYPGKGMAQGFWVVDCYDEF